MSEYYNIFCENQKRVEGLNSLYINLKKANQSDSGEYKLTDILRAAVVLLHSSFEEYFRNILIQWLPVKADKETLKQIPISLNAGKRPEKLYLSDLSDYRERSVDDVIRDSVKAHLELKSFNNEEDIRSWCSKINISLDGFMQIKVVDAAIKRRHKIVHEADTNRGNNQNRLQAIKPSDITSWISAYEQLVEIIETNVKNWEEIDEQADR